MSISEEKKKWLLSKYGATPEPRPDRKKTLAEIGNEWLARAGETRASIARADVSRNGKQAPKARPSVKVCMGFDLGTSCSKVVIRAVAPRFAVAATFPEGAKYGLPSLLPTRLYVLPDGMTSIEARKGIPPVVDLKIALMTNPDDCFQLGSNKSLKCRPIDLVAAFLGSSIRHCRNQFLAGARERLPADSKYEWAFNIGLPARSRDDARINDAFMTAACAGWQLSWGNGHISLKLAAEVVDRITRDRPQLAGIDYGSIATVPEVTAEATGYARSSLRQYGTHLLVDVGATTLDACLFILFDRDGDLCYTLLDADVNRDFGAIGLQRRRMEEVAAIMARLNPFQAVAASVHDYLEDASRCKGLESVDEPFAGDCVGMLQGVVYRAKLKAPDDLNELIDTRAQRESRNDTRLRVIVCGGGARVGIYSAVVGTLEKQVRSGGAVGLAIKPFEVLGRLPRPDGLEMPDEMNEHYDRLAVAYGLSFPVDNIGHFIPPSQIENAPPRSVRVSSDMTTKDAV